jgi:hypothetical protein
MKQRRLSVVPRTVIALAIVALASQIAFAVIQPRPQARAEELPVPPPRTALRAMSLGDPIPLAQFSTLWLQAFDNQPGVSIPFLNLDYGKVEAWLQSILQLDPRGQYPLMMASQLYAQVPDERKQRQMLALVYREFLTDPNRRWPWMAHAAIMAKHRLNDLPLALKYAQALAAHATSADVPHWARQMEIFLYEDLGEYETARILLGGLLNSGAVQDAHETRFLIERLNALKDAEKSSSTSEK